MIKIRTCEIWFFYFSYFIIDSDWVSVSHLGSFKPFPSFISPLPLSFGMATYAEDLAAMQAAFTIMCQILLSFKGLSEYIDRALAFLNEYGKVDIPKVQDQIDKCCGGDRDNHAGYYNSEDGKFYYDQAFFAEIRESVRKPERHELQIAVDAYYSARRAVYSYAEHRDTLFRSLRDALIAYNIDLGDDGDHIATIRPAIRSIPASNNYDDRKKKYLVMCAYDEYKSYRMYRERR